VQEALTVEDLYRRLAEAGIQLKLGYEERWEHVERSNGIATAILRVEVL